MSGQLAGERDELRTVLASLARVLGTVKGFVHENRKVLGKDIELLTSLLERVDNQKDTLGLVVQKGSIGPEQPRHRLRVQHRHVRLPGAGRPGHPVPSRPVPRRDLHATPAVRQPVCPVLETLLESLLTPAASASAASAKAPEPTAAPTDPDPGACRPI